MEKNVLDARRGLWTEVPQTFASFAQLNAWLADRFRHSTAAAKTKIKAREQAKKTAPVTDNIQEIEEPF